MNLATKYTIIATWYSSITSYFHTNASDFQIVIITLVHINNNNNNIFFNMELKSNFGNSKGALDTERSIIDKM